jgi:hypothetical protein
MVANVVVVSASIMLCCVVVVVVVVVPINAAMYIIEFQHAEDAIHCGQASSSLPVHFQRVHFQRDMLSCSLALLGSAGEWSGSANSVPVCLKMCVVHSNQAPASTWADGSCCARNAAADILIIVA